MEFHEGANTVCVKNLPVEDSVWFIETLQSGKIDEHPDFVKIGQLYTCKK